MVQGEKKVKIFTMKRLEDETGVSGTGVVLEGVEFSNGHVVVNWMSAKHPEANSIAIFDSWAAFEEVHITPHPGNKTEITWRY